MNPIAETAKSVGLSILKSKVFWYITLGLIAFIIIRRTVKGSTPKVASLPSGEDSSKATQTWWNGTGQPIMNRAFLALKNEYWLTGKRNDAYIEMLKLDRAQLTYLYNQFNKQYSVDYFKGESLTKVIDGQFWYIEKGSAMVERLTGWNLI